MDFFSKCGSHLLKKSLIGNFIFCAVQILESILMGWEILYKKGMKTTSVRRVISGQLVSYKHPL